MKKALYYWLPLFCWLGAIFAASSLPGENLPDLSKFSLDKIAHGLEYFILGLLMMRAFEASFPNMGLTKMAILSIILCALYGASDELHQRWVPGRQSDIADLATDAIGAGAAALVFAYIIKETKDHAEH